MNKLKAVSLGLFALTLTACNGENSTSDQKEQVAPKQLTSQEIDKLNTDYLINSNVVTKTVIQPPEPEPMEDSKVLSGIDTNNNNIPDRTDRVVWQSLGDTGNVSISDFNKIEKIAQLISLKPNAKQNSINQNDIYCLYNSLNSDIQDSLPIDVIFESLLNTSERKKAFDAAATPVNASLGKEFCNVK